MKILNKIAFIKEHPERFMKEEKIEYVYYYLMGYCSIFGTQDKDDIDQKYFTYFSDWLIDWIKKNIDEKYVPQSDSWYEIIKDITKEPKKPLNVFYDLTKLFFEDYEAKRGYFSENLSKE